MVGGGARCTQLDNLPRASQRWSWSVHAWGSRASPERAAAEIWRLSMWGSHALREARHRRPGCAAPVPSGFYKGMVNGVQWRSTVRDRKRGKDVRVTLPWRRLPLASRLTRGVFSPKPRCRLPATLGRRNISCECVQAWRERNSAIDLPGARARMLCTPLVVPVVSRRTTA